MLGGLLMTKRWAKTLAESDLLWQGFFFTLRVALAGLAVALVLGTMLGVFSTTRPKILHGIARVYVEIYQNTPVVAQVFFMYTAGPRILMAIQGASSP